MKSEEMEDGENEDAQIAKRYWPDIGHLGTDIDPILAYDIGPISGISVLCRTEIADIGPI